MGNNTSFFLKYPIKIQGNSFYISDGLSSPRVKSHETINIEQYNIDSIEEVYLNVEIFNSKLNLYFDFNKNKTELRIYTGKNCEIKPINGGGKSYYYQNPLLSSYLYYDINLIIKFYSKSIDREYKIEKILEK